MRLGAAVPLATSALVVAVNDTSTAWATDLQALAAFPLSLFFCRFREGRGEAGRAGAGGTRFPGGNLRCVEFDRASVDCRGRRIDPIWGKRDELLVLSRAMISPLPQRPLKIESSEKMGLEYVLRWGNLHDDQ